MTFIGGHSFSTSLPYANNSEGPYLRAFYNSLFFNGSAVAKVDLAYSPTTYPQNGTGPLSVSIVNTGGSVATSSTTSASRSRPGFTYVSTSFGPTPTVAGNTLTWVGGLGDIAGGQTAVTIQLAVDSSVSGTHGREAVRDVPRDLRRRLRRGVHGGHLPRDHRVARSGADAHEDAGDARGPWRPGRR